jgi:anaerobic selenocysteine-containing dehydrogenase
VSRVERKPVICGVCPGGCAIIAALEDGRLIKTEADRNNPYGAICVRGLAAPEIVYSPDRLTTPLIRTGERGEGKFRKATWDEALDLTSRSMQGIKEKYGAQAMAYHYGRGAFEHSVNELGAKWLYPFGSPNVAGVGSLCAVAMYILAPVPTFGFSSFKLIRDIENSKTIVVWGANPITDSPPFVLPRIIKAKRRGAKVIAIDHMRSDIAQRADQWIAVRSGTDGALALGMLRTIINENLYDHEFVEKWTVGFNELKEYVQKFTPEEVERITRVPAQAVVNLAREIATTRHASLVMYTGLEYSNSGVQNIRAVYLLWAITGNLDVPGGLCISPDAIRHADFTDLKAPDNIQRIGAREYPLFNELVKNAQYMEMPKAVLEGNPYRVKGVLINGASTLINYPQPEILEKAYRELEFLAVIDIFMTKDAFYADVVFPAASMFEKLSYQRYDNYVRLRERVIAPVGESRNDLLILAAIADRLGYGSLLPQTEEEILERAFAQKPDLLNALRANPDGIRLEKPETQYKKWELGLIRTDGNPGFDTPSGKLEIASSILAKFGYDALPKYIEPIEGPLADPDLAGRYPLVLNTGARLINTFRSQHLNIKGLVKLQEKPLVLINPKDAEKRGIRGGDKVTVRTARGQVQLWANVTDRVLPGGVEVNVGGGSPIQVETWRNANINAITDFYNRDSISGFPIFKALLCEVEKAKQ